jgi:CrcB protein
MPVWLWVCLGGALGSGARYALTGWVQTASGSLFPWGTLCVNVAGSFLIGLILAATLPAPNFPTSARLFLTTGVMGGFTTFSAFSWETLVLARDGAVGLAAANAALNLVGCVGACFLGVALASAVLWRGGS